RVADAPHTRPEQAAARDAGGEGPSDPPEGVPDRRGTSPGPEQSATRLQLPLAPSARVRRCNAADGASGGSAADQRDLPGSPAPVPIRSTRRRRYSTLRQGVAGRVDQV